MTGQKQEERVIWGKGKLTVDDNSITWMSSGGMQQVRVENCTCEEDMTVPVGLSDEGHVIGYCMVCEKYVRMVRE